MNEIDLFLIDISIIQTSVIIRKIKPNQCDQIGRFIAIWETF